jgi:putative transposase
MDHQSVRKTFTHQLLPTPEQERTLATVVWRCRERSNAGLQERKAAWETCGISVSFAMQSAQLPSIKELRPDDRDLHAQVLHDVLHRLDKAFAAFFRRVTTGEPPATRASRARTSMTASPTRRSARMAVRVLMARC